MNSSPRRALACCCLLVLAACGGDKAPNAGASGSGGTVVVALAGEPDHLAPPLVVTISGKMVVDQVFQTLATVGADGNTLGDVGFAPSIAASWTWSADSSSVDLHVDPRARFHDGHPVRAADVKFSYDLYMDPAVASPHVASFPAMDSVVVTDSMTVRGFFRERSPERFFKLVTNLSVVPQHLLQQVDRAKLAESPFAQTPVGSGPYRFVKWERGASMELAADTSRTTGRPATDRLIFRFVPDLNAAARSVTAGEADFVESLRPEGMAMVTADGPARPVEYPSPDHGYVMFNTRSSSNRKVPHPLLGDRQLRVALAMAVDRKAVIRNALDSLALPSFGPFVRSLWSADTTVAQIPYSADAARRLLDSLGWRDANGDGVRERNGKPLHFTLLVPSVSATRRQMAVALQDQFKQVGADVTIDAPEPAVLFPRLQQGKFDAFIQVWHEDATPSTIGQVWSGRDLERSANYGWYGNARVDSLIDLAATATDRTKARALYREIYELIVQDAPAIFLWEPRTFALANKRIKFSGLNGTAWWSGIPSWRIPAGERIARDRVGGSKS